MYYSSGDRWKLVYGARYQSARERKAAGLLPFQGISPGVLAAAAQTTARRQDEMFGDVLFGVLGQR